VINRLLFVVVAVGFVAAGTVLLIGIRLDPEHAPMGVYYLSMTCRCAWHGLPKAVMFIILGIILCTSAIAALSVVTKIRAGRDECLRRRVEAANV